MNSFQKIVLVIALIILLISLFFIGVALYYARYNNWPPMVPNCPDYWVNEGTGKNSTCVNVQNLGTCSATSGDSHLTMNFNNAPYVGANGNCAKYTWANNCQISWDGLTYGVPNPCVSQSSSSN